MPVDRSASSIAFPILSQRGAALRAGREDQGPRGRYAEFEPTLRVQTACILVMRPSASVRRC